MSELPVYKTWLERSGHIETVVTDAPGNIRLVDADDYAKLQSERDKLATDRLYLMEALESITNDFDEWGDIMARYTMYQIARTTIDKIKAQEARDE